MAVTSPASSRYQIHRICALHLMSTRSLRPHKSAEVRAFSVISRITQRDAGQGTVVPDSDVSCVSAN